MEEPMPYNTTQSNQLAHYLKYQGPGTPNIDFEVVKAFVNNGANPLVCRYGDGSNLFGIASYNKWTPESWLKLIDICKSGKVTPDEFTNGLAKYLQYQGPGTPNIDFEVVKAFVNNGANPLVCRYGDGSNLFGIASYNKWSSANLLELNRIVNLYENCIKIKLPPSIPISKTFIQGFDQEFKEFSAVINQLKQKTNSSFKFEQNYKSASIAGEELLANLAKHRRDYEERKITIDEFRTLCGTDIKTALQTDLAKQHVICRALVSFLNFIAGLTIVIPIATKITTGRWGLFTNSETESEKHLGKIADNLRGLAEPENLPEQTSSQQIA